MGLISKLFGKKKNPIEAEAESAQAQSATTAQHAEPSSSAASAALGSTASLVATFSDDGEHIPFSTLPAKELGFQGASVLPLPLSRSKEVIAKAIEHGEMKAKEYKESKTLGRGVTGYVSAAVHLPTGRNVAIKHVSKGSFFKSSHIDEAVTEIAILRSIHHPNIIALLDFFETKDAICLVFEQASGGELFDRLEHLGHYTERDAACIAAVLCNALDYIHQRGILHRDIKTHNVLFMDKSFDSRIVLVDFGISKILMDPRGFTQTIGMGTPSFTAPEVIEGVKYGAKCDDWSLGVLIHHLLAGYGPFDSFLDYADILAKQAEGPKFDTEEWTVITPEAKDFVRRMLSVRPSKRMTAGEALSHPWIKMMVPDMYLAQLRSINDRLLGIVRASTPLPSGSVTPIPISGKSEPEAAHSTEAPPAILSSSMLSPDELASETLKMSASLSASVPSPLFISQSLNRAAVGKLPDLIPKELSESDLPETMPISIASRGRTAADGDAVSGSLLPLETPDSLPDFAKADSIGVPIGSYVSVELPGLTMRKRQASVSSAAALKSLSTAPINASKMVPVGESAGELMADIQAETE